jgi:hypothetical protein
MPHFPVLQPDGNSWAMYSTIVDGFTMFDASLGQILHELAEWHRFDVDRETAHLKRIMAGEAPDYQHWKTWNDAAASALFFHAGHDDVRGYITERTPPDRMQIIDGLVAEHEDEDLD